MKEVSLLWKEQNVCRGMGLDSVWLLLLVICDVSLEHENSLKCSKYLCNCSVYQIEITSIIQLAGWMDCTDVCSPEWAHKGGEDLTATWSKGGHAEGGEYWKYYFICSWEGFFLHNQIPIDLYYTLFDMLAFILVKL